MNQAKRSKTELYGEAEKLKSPAECVEFLKTLADHTENHLRSAVWNNQMSYDIIERLDKARTRKSEK